MRRLKSQRALQISIQRYPAHRPCARGTSLRANGDLPLHQKKTGLLFPGDRPFGECEVWGEAVPDLFQVKAVEVHHFGPRGDEV